MSLHVYSIMWNEEFMLPHFLKHYEEVADKIFILDHHSTDRTAEIAKAHPKVEYGEYSPEGWDEDQVSWAFRIMAKMNPSDWAVCVDGDEFIHGLDNLEGKSGILKTKGYMMVGESGELEDCWKVREKRFDKPVVFSGDIEFTHGRHGVKPGYLVQDSDLELWHYKYPSRYYYLSRNLLAYDRIMNAKEAKYRIKKGLAWYDRMVASHLDKEEV